MLSFMSCAAQSLSMTRAESRELVEFANVGEEVVIDDGIETAFATLPATFDAPSHALILCYACPAHGRANGLI